MRLRKSVTVERWRAERQVGNRADAVRAARGELRKVGAGFMRKVYLDDSGRTVYKVAPDANANASEYRRMHAIADSPLLAQYATPCTLYTLPDGVVVEAQPYMPLDSIEVRDRSAIWALLDAIEDHNKLCMSTGAIGAMLQDMHDGNYRADARGRLHITDCGDVFAQAAGDQRISAEGAGTCDCTACVLADGIIAAAILPHGTPTGSPPIA